MGIYAANTQTLPYQTFGRKLLLANHKTMPFLSSPTTEDLVFSTISNWLVEANPPSLAFKTLIHKEQMIFFYLTVLNS